MKEPKMPIRHINHQLSAKSQKVFESVIPSNWVVRPMGDDYGIDYEVEIFEQDGKATSEKFYVQLKSTSETDVNKFTKETLKISTYNYLSQQRYPVMVVKYVENANILLFKWIFEKFKNPIKENAKTLTLEFDLTKCLTPANVFEIRNTLRSYIRLIDKKYVSPISMNLVINSNKVSKSGLHLALSQMKKECALYFDLVESEYDGEIIISENECQIVLGGGASSFGFPISDSINNAVLIKEIILATSILLSHHGIRRVAGNLLAQSYDCLSFYGDETFVTSVLMGLFASKEYEAMCRAYFWLATNTPYYNQLLFFSAMMYRNLHTFGSDFNASLEDIFITNIAINELNGDSIQLAASLYTLGNFYRSTSKYTDAMELYNRARKTSSTYLKRDYLFLEIGSLLYNRNKPGMALRFYQLAHQTSPTSQALYQIADCYLALNDFKNAFKNYEDGRTIDDKKSVHYWLKGVCLGTILESFTVKGSKGKFKAKKPPHKTEKEWINQIESDLKDARAWFNLGISQSRLHKHDEAVCSFTWSAMLVEHDIEAWTNAFNSAFNAMKTGKTTSSDSKSIIATSVFATAYELNGADFIGQVFAELDKNPSEETETIKGFIMQMASTLTSDKPFEFRSINDDLTQTIIKD